MTRYASIAALVAVALASGASAQAPAGYYVAVPAAAPTQPSLVTHVTPWRLQDGAYVAAQAPERHQVLCQLIVERTGALSRFTVRGKAYDAGALAKCNARAKPIGTATASR